MATRPQIAMIHTIKNKIGIGDDQYRAMLNGFGVESSKELSTGAAKAFIELLISQIKGGGKPPLLTALSGSASANNINRGDVRAASSNATATFAQQAYIRNLWNAVSRAPNEMRADALNAFLEKRFQISHLSWLPRARVGAVIHTLTAMAKQKGVDNG